MSPSSHKQIEPIFLNPILSLYNVIQIHCNIVDLHTEIPCLVQSIYSQQTYCIINGNIAITTKSKLRRGL